MNHPANLLQSAGRVAAPRRGARSVHLLARAHGYEIRGSDAEAAALIARLLPAYVVADAGYAARRFSIERTGNGFTLGGPDGDGAVRSRGAFAEYLEFVLARAILDDATDAVQLHAAAAVGPAGVVVAAGPSGAGKSSLATYWWARGLEVLGDDVVFLEGDRRVTPFKRHFKVHPDLLRHVGVKPSNTPCWTPASPEAWFDPGAWGAGGTPGIVAFVRYDPSGPMRVREVSRREALHALTHGALPTGVGGGERFDRIADMVAEVTACEVRFPSVTEAGAFLAGEVGA